MFNLFKKKPKPEPLPVVRPARHTSGHKVYALNLETLDITEAGDTVEMHPGYWYCAALNIKNAEKQFIKMAKK